MKTLLLLTACFGAAWAFERTTRENSSIEYHKCSLYSGNRTDPLQSAFKELIQFVEQNKMPSQKSIESYNSEVVKFIAEMKKNRICNVESYPIEPSNMLFNSVLYESLDSSYQQLYLETFDETFYNCYYHNEFAKRIKSFLDQYPQPIEIKKVQFRGQDYYGIKSSFRFLFNGKEIPKEGLILPIDKLFGLEIRY